MKARISLLAILALGVSLSATAQEVDDGEFSLGPGGTPQNGVSADARTVHLGYPDYNGDGCRPGTVAATLSPDARTLSLLYDDYIVSAGQGVRRDQRSCSLRIPVNVPAGLQAAVVKMDYRGFNSVPVGGKTEYSVNYSFSDARGRMYRKTYRRKKAFHGPVDDLYLMTAEVYHRPLYSMCGQSFNLHVDTSVFAQSNGHGDDVLATVDSVDAGSDQNIEYHLVWRECVPGREHEGNPGDDRSDDRRREREERDRIRDGRGSVGPIRPVRPERPRRR